MKIKGFSCLLLCFLAMSGSVYASIEVGYTPIAPVPEKTPGHFEIIGGIGISKFSAGNSELGVTSSETDTLVQTRKKGNALGQLGLGYVYYFGSARQYSDQVQWFPSIEPELNIYRSSNKGIKGDVWRFNSPDFNDLTYSLPTLSTRLMLDVALTVASWKRLSVYAKGGIGNAWTRISYSDIDKDGGIGDPCPEQRLSLDSNTRSNFAWEAGAGLALALTERVSLSLEYLYTNLGKISTSASGDTGIITEPVILPAHFKLKSETWLLGLHIAL